VPREDKFIVDVGKQMATLVTVRWRTPPPDSIDERLIITDDLHARLDVLRPRSLGDTVGTYEGEVDEADVRELTAAGPEVQFDVVVQNPQLVAVGIAADRVVQRLLAAPLATAQFFARPVGAVPPLPQTLALGVLGGGSQPVEFELDLDECVVHFAASGSPVSSTPLPELPMGFTTSNAEGLGGVRQRATIAPGIVGAISVPLSVPDGANELRVQVVGSWFLPGEEQPDDFEVRTESQKL
jgi:hypothetical protein